MRIFLLVVLLAVSTLFFPVFGANHPELNWRSVSTEHFVINYYEAVEPAVYPTWKIAEEVYKSIREAYGYTMKRKINISLADYDDYSNGWAEWTSANIMIWIPDLRFDLRGNSTWLRNVITHELTHIISMENKRKLQILNVNANVTLQSIDETYSINEPFLRITSYPSWLSEGIAQLEAETQGNDCWDTRRDMSLRSAVLDNKLLTLDEMGHFNHSGFGSEKVYNQGFSFTKHIERTIGKEKLRELFEKGSEEPTPFRYLFGEFTGYSVEKLYVQWKDSLQEYYKKVIPSDATVDNVLVSNGTYSIMPEISANGKYMACFSSGKDDGGRTDLYVKDISNGKVILKESYAHTAVAFSPVSDKIYFVKSRDQNRNGSLFNDIFSRDLITGKRERITYNARVYDIALTPDGKDLICIRYKDNVYFIDKLNLESGSFSRLIDGQAGSPFMSVCQNLKNAQELLLTRLVDGKSRLFRYNGQNLTPVGPALGQEESPFCGPDGRIYYSADYDGIFNIYSIDSIGSDLKRHSRVVGGYFSPYVMSDGSLLVSKFGSNGFSVVKFTPEQVQYEIQDSVSCTFKSLPVPQGKVVIKAHPYKGGMLRSTVGLELGGVYMTNRSFLSNQYVPDVDTAQLQIWAGLQSYKSDALHKSFLALMCNLGVFSDLTEETDSKNSYSRVMNTDSITKNIKFDKNGQNSSFNTVTSFLRKPSLAMNFSNASQTQADSSDSTEAPKTLPFVAPGIGFGSEIGEADISGAVQVSLAMLVIPAQVNAMLTIERQFTPEISFLVNANLAWLPFVKAVQFNLPIVLQWSKVGYINEDIMYNLADYISISGYFIPVVSPLVEKYYSSSGKIEERMTHLRGNVSGFMTLFSLPVWKYSSVQLQLDESLIHYQKKISFTDFEKISVNYDIVSSEIGAKWVFPIVRTVNKQFIYYWDALYGSVGYKHNFMANPDFFVSDQFRWEALSKENYSSYSAAAHTINASLTFGHTKEYLFDKQFAIDFNYEFLRKKTDFSVILGF